MSVPTLQRLPPSDAFTTERGSIKRLRLTVANPLPVAIRYHAVNDLLQLLDTRNIGAYGSVQPGVGGRPCQSSL